MRNNYEPTIQLLLKIEACRIVRSALAAYIEKSIISEDEKDVAWAILAELTSKMNYQKRKSS